MCLQTRVGTWSHSQSLVTSIVQYNSQHWPPALTDISWFHKNNRQAGLDVLQGRPTKWRESNTSSWYFVVHAWSYTLQSLKANIRQLQKTGCVGLSWCKIWAVLGPVGLQFTSGQGCRPHMQPRTARRAEPTDCVGTSHSRQYSCQSSSTCMDHLCVFKGWPIWSWKPIIKRKLVHPPTVVLYKDRKETVY